MFYCVLASFSLICVVESRKKSLKLNVVSKLTVIDINVILAESEVIDVAASPFYFGNHDLNDELSFSISAPSELGRCKRVFVP